MTTSSDSTLKTRILSKIHFLEDQLASLNQYLPETYEYLMRELDLQKLTLVELEVQGHYNHVDENEIPK